MDKYKISIWEDVDNGSTLQEQKIAEIGSNTMTAQYRALEPVLTENSNGTHTFTFKMYYHYVDNQTGEEVDNPFISLMVNERKVKVLWKDKWYDFIIKDVTKDSSNKSLSFSCQDLYVNELSKNGFNLEFDTELENNIGTISELAAKVLEGTDWNLGTSDTLIQYQEETLWDVLVTSATAVPDRGDDDPITLTNKHVYMFNSSFQQGSGKVQFLYGEDPITTVDGSNVIIDHYQDSDSDWNCYSADLNSFSGTLTIYRGRRVVNSVKQIYDEKLNKYVDVYTKNSATYYVNRTTSIETPQTISNLIINAKDFDSVIGWHTPSTNIGLTQVMWPTYTSTAGTAYTGKGYLKAVTLNAAGTYTTDIVPGPITLINDGLSANIISLPKEGLQIGQKYVVRSVAYADNVGAPSTSTVDLGFDGICTIKSIDGTTTTATYFTQVDSSPVWEVSSPITFEDLNKNVVSLNFTMPSETTWIEKVEFFPYAATESSYIEPNNFTNASYVVKEVYTVYSSDALSQEPTERASEQYNSLEEVTNNGYTAETDQEKIRSINVKESNRFNILQTLAETFNCWAVFDIAHDQQTGEITGKTVSFKEQLGEETGLGFVYGIDLRTVSRNLNSTNIVTKTIVKQNSNEFGEDGFCTIARAKENYGKENFVLDFNYYINQGLLDGATINADLYGTTAPAMGYLYNLNQLNTSYDSNIDTLVQDKQVLTQYQALLTVKFENVKALQQQIEVAQNTIITKMDETDWNSAITSEKLEQPSPDGWVEMLNAIASEKLLEDKLAEEQLQLASLQDMVEQLESAIEDLEQAQESIIEQKEDLNEAFFTKYGSYLQEGTWVSEEYYDDTLYYLDALNVASTSAEPQVSYNISVLRLQALEEFKAKVFNIGDTVFIEDPEFFGYEWINGIKTPIRKKVLVSQIVSHFENPTQDTITIQNYKTDFEDLFQRITASTQSLQFSSGSYNRAAGIVATNGGITGDVLQTTLTNNNNLVYQTLNNSITQDATGITLSDLSNPNNKVKITANGLYISDDGGINWKNAIRGNGIGTEYLSAGSIATNKINIYDGEWPTFRWDKDGLSAYRHDGSSVFYDNFVRFDQYGIYGVKGQNDGALDRWIPSGEKGNNSVWGTADFGLTWSGFFLKSNNNGGYVSITSDEDIQVIRNGNPEITAIKIGRLNDDELYGIRINNAAGDAVIETRSDGNLYLSDKLYVSSSNITLGRDTNISKDVQTPSGTERVYAAINANRNFIVYEDGSLVATNATIAGAISSASGSFGSNGQVLITENGLQAGEVTLGSNGLAVNVKDDQGAITGIINVNKDGFFIKKNDEGNTNIFSVNNAGELTLTGTGTFNGEIVATSGSIGGFNIINGVLTSANEKLKLDGENGSIEINLGKIGGFEIGERTLSATGIEIASSDSDGTENTSYIKIGENISLNSENNTGTFGTITIDGTNSIIRDSGGGYTITPDISVFTNIVATGEIRTTIYAQDTVQAVGSQMIFRPTYKIDNIEIVGTTLKFESDTFSKAGDLFNHYFYIVDDDGKKKYCTITKDANSVTPKYIVNFSVTPQSFSDYRFVIDLGIPEESLSIGINSGETDGNNLLGKGITFNTFKIINNNVIYDPDPKVFLGDLKSLNIGAITDFGLYSTNAFLKGSLVTKYNANEAIKYAGVNTLGAAEFNWAGEDTPEGFEEDKSPIIFWSGSDGMAPEQVKLSPFQVTSNGTLYANQAYITGSIISRSILQGTELWTAKIRGYYNSTDAPLEIYSGDQQIKFYRAYNDDAASPFLSINSSGLGTIKDGKYDNFIIINGTEASIKIGNYYLTNNGLGNGIKNFYTIQNGDAIIANGSNVKLSVTEHKISLNGVPQFDFSSEFYYKQQDETKGYDLYVLS